MIVLAGVDAGGTRTRLALVSADGKVLSYVEGGCSSFAELGNDGAEGVLRHLWTMAWRKTGATPRPVESLFIGSGSILADKDEEVCRKLAVSIGMARADRIHAKNDAWAALAGGLSGRPGILLIAGTGSVCLGRNKTGAFWRAGGWGHLLHDGGSAYALGLGAMVAVTRAVDGRGPATRLMPEVKRVLGLKDLHDIYRRLHHEGADRALIASLAPSVVELSESGDEAARALVESGVRDLVECVVTVAHQLNLTAPQLALTGGLIDNAESYRRRFLSQLHVELPGTVRVDDGLDPVWGAVMLAEEHLMAHPPRPEFVRRLRSEVNRKP